MGGYKVGVKERSIYIGYTLGISLFLASIIYFFASNWPGFERYTKIGLSIGLVVLFYGSAILLSRLFLRQAFLSELVMFAGSIAFGASLALLGQIYNSHADSFMLFAIWSIPTLAFAFITRYQPYYVLSFVLIHLSAWFFLFPTLSFYFNHEFYYRLFFVLVAIANGFLYSAVENDYIQSRTLKLLSFIACHIALLILSSGKWLEGFSSIMSVIYLVILTLWFLNYMKSARYKWYSILLGLAAVAFILIKFFAFLMYVGSEYVFLFTIFLPLVIIAGTLYFIKKWRAKDESHVGTLSRNVLISIIVAVSSVIGASSISGILFVLIGNVPYVFSYLLSILVLIGPGVLVKKWDHVIRHTLIFTGLLLSVPSAIFMTSFQDGALMILAIILTFVLVNTESLFIRLLVYPLINVQFIVLLIKENASENLIMLILVLMNSLVWFLSRKRSSSTVEFLFYNSYFYGILSFFIWTFLHQKLSAIYFIINGLFFLITTFSLFSSLRKNTHMIFRLSLGFWFLYLAYKYYDNLWSLLNKSISFLIIGLVFLFTAYLFDSKENVLEPNIGYVHKRWLPIMIVLVLQFSFIGLSVGKNEHLLSKGETVKLAVQPVDPRSIIQGDFLALQYTISNITLTPEPRYNQRVHIRLVKDSQGVYKYSPLSSDGKKHSSDGKGVWITGRYKGNGVIDYGIETYFVPENSSLRSQNVTYALVKVSKNGNAIVLSVR